VSARLESRWSDRSGADELSADANQFKKAFEDAQVANNKLGGSSEDTPSDSLPAADAEPAAAAEEKKEDEVVPVNETSAKAEEEEPKEEKVSA
jgi:hypothetical protein